MNRIQLFEIHEQPWCPSLIRDGVTRFLSYSTNLGDYYGGAAWRIQEAMCTSGAHKVIDLGSGSGGPWPAIYPRMRSGVEGGIDVVLTDKFPNQSITKRLNQAADFGIQFHQQPVDIREVPVELKGFRTIFTAFHHFPPHEARSILQDAVSKNQGIGIFEFTGREPLTLFLTLLAPLYVLMLTPFIRPFSWGGVFWTYFIPVIPFVVAFDGIVSCLRTYSPAEMKQLISTISTLDYEWDIGQYRIPFVFMKVTYTIGCPVVGHRLPQQLAVAATTPLGDSVKAHSLASSAEPRRTPTGQPQPPEQPRKPR